MNTPIVTDSDTTSFDQELYDAVMNDPGMARPQSVLWNNGFDSGAHAAASESAKRAALHPRNRLSGIDPQYHNAELIEIFRTAAAIEAGEEGPWLNTSKYPCSIAGIQAVKDALVTPVKAEESR